jgi:hypothetical protein
MKGAPMSKAITGTVVGVVLLLSACSSSSKSSSTATTSAPTVPATAAATTTTAAAPAQTVTITPNTGLKDQQVVQVVGKGYSAGKSYSVIECADKGAATGAGDCDLRGIKVATADSTGTVTSPFTALKGPFGSNNIVCSATQGCILSVANAGSAAPTEVATGTITFA